jgi:hypothetical protein
MDVGVTVNHRDVIYKVTRSRRSETNAWLHVINNLKHYLEYHQGKKIIVNYD